MTRTWISSKDKRWVMQCDRLECTTRSEPFDMSPALLVFAKRGWFVAQSFGDRCPECVGLGLLSGAEPSVLMERARLASANCAALAEQSKHLAAHPMNGDDGRDE